MSSNLECITLIAAHLCQYEILYSKIECNMRKSFIRKKMWSHCTVENKTMKTYVHNSLLKHFCISNWSAAVNSKSNPSTQTPATQKSKSNSQHPYKPPLPTDQYIQNQISSEPHPIIHPSCQPIYHLVNQKNC